MSDDPTLSDYGISDLYVEYIEHELEESLKETLGEKIMDGWHGGYSSTTGEYESPVDTVESEPTTDEHCKYCNGTGKNKTNIIQQPCSHCEGTGKQL